MPVLGLLDQVRRQRCLSPTRQTRAHPPLCIVPPVDHGTWKDELRYRLSHTRAYEQYLHPAANLCLRFNTPDPPVPTAELLRRRPGSIQQSAQLCGNSVSYILRAPGMDVDPQQCFGPTTELQRISDDSSEGGTSRGPGRETKAPRWESGKGSGRPANNPSPPMQQRRGRPPKGGPPHQDLTQVVKAVARLGL